MKFYIELEFRDGDNEYKQGFVLEADSIEECNEKVEKSISEWFGEGQYLDHGTWYASEGYPSLQHTYTGEYDALSTLELMVGRLPK